MKSPALFTSSLAIGDCICATPLIRKLSTTYNSKVRVFSHYPELFKNLPYVSSSDDAKDWISKTNILEEEYDMNYSFGKMGKKVQLSDDRGIEMKHAIMDIRQYHAIDCGFMLKKNELHCDFIPNPEDKVTELPEKYVVLHPFKNWESRTWSENEWRTLIGALLKREIPVILIGKDGVSASLMKHIENDSVDITKEIQGKSTFKFDLQQLGLIDLTNKTTLSELWYILDSATCVVTMDSGILHLAGTTDAHIIQLGSSIDPEFRAPYRNGSQTYKYDYVPGSCNLLCASDMKYSLSEWEHGYNGATPIQSVPPLDKCLEKKPTYECHPKAEAVLEKIIEIYENFTPSITEKHIVETEENRVLIHIHSDALGDNIGALSMIDLFVQKTGKKVDVLCKFGLDIFGKSYPNFQFIPIVKGEYPVIDIKTGNWVYKGKVYSAYTELRYVFDKPLMKGFADQLEIEYVENRPKIDVHVGERPIKGKYVCFSLHSTAQSKYWNYPNAWDLLCRMLRKEGITPVCIDRHEQFGIEGHWNPVPNSCVKRPGLDLKEMTNYIHHSEFFIGISSGLSWVAHAVGKPVVLISGVTSEDNEFSTDTLRIIEKSVCHGCINKTEHRFNPGDWLWCPVHRGSAQQFECTISIAPQRVFDEIKNWEKYP